ncbi:MAG: 3-keto-disaccharide hydrolase, partial [Planctomycetota bacterium]
VLVGGGDAITRREFLNFQLHLEFFCPEMPGQRGQARANSGVYLHGRYEVQVLESFGQPPAGNGCGAIYSIAAPLVNASRPAGSWQTYDIVFRAPRYDAVDALVELPRVTVLHNGVVIHNNVELPKPTPGGTDQTMRTMGPILLQDHGDPVRYRNIWVRSLD